MNQIKIVTTANEIAFIGRYRRDLETDNWHYYETDANELIHVRKEHLVMVISSKI